MKINGQKAGANLKIKKVGDKMTVKDCKTMQQLIHEVKMFTKEDDALRFLHEVAKDERWGMATFYAVLRGYEERWVTGRKRGPSFPEQYRKEINGKEIDDVSCTWDGFAWSWNFKEERWLIDIEESGGPPSPHEESPTQPPKFILVNDEHEPEE